MTTHRSFLSKSFSFLANAYFNFTGLRLMVIVPSALPVSIADANGAASRNARTRPPIWRRVIGASLFNSDRVTGESTRTVARMSLLSIGQEAFMHKRCGVAISLLVFTASFAGEASAAKPNAEATAKLLE